MSGVCSRPICRWLRKACLSSFIALNTYIYIVCEKGGRLLCIKMTHPIYYAVHNPITNVYSLLLSCINVIQMIVRWSLCSLNAVLEYGRHGEERDVKYNHLNNRRKLEERVDQNQPNPFESTSKLSFFESHTQACYYDLKFALHASQRADAHWSIFEKFFVFVINIFSLSLSLYFFFFFFFFFTQALNPILLLFPLRLALLRLLSMPTFPIHHSLTHSLAIFHPPSSFPSYLVPT